MANPWTKKNPFLSMWLSAANTWAGAGRSLMAAEWRRQQKAATRPPAKKQPRRKRD